MAASLGPLDVGAGGFAPRQALVLGDDGHLTRGVADALEAAGVPVVGVIGGPAAVAAVDPGASDLVVDLNVVPGGGGGAVTERALGRTWAVLQAVLPRWGAIAEVDRVSYVAVTCLGGRLGLQPPFGHACDSGIWAGVAKALVHEAPACRVRAVDVADDCFDELGPIVVGELRHGRHVEVGRTRTAWWTAFPACRWVDIDARSWGPSDLVVFTGGGRGIGWSAATGLAARFGTRVIVSGRATLDRGVELAALDDERYAALCHDELVASDRGNVRSRRLRVESWHAQRQVAANLAEANRRGLPIDYRPCDVTNPDSVLTLLGEFASEVTGIVHNAGLNRPTRFANKTLADVLEVVRVKVSGFRNLAVAIATLAPPRLGAVFVVGSLSGRSGGMLGELDYAAANEGLSRLALSMSESLPVGVVAWPTWASDGMANRIAAARYMELLPEADGVALWLREMCSPGGAEVLVMGRVTGNVNPVLAAGLSVSHALPHAASLSTSQVLLGTVERFRPGRELVHRVRLGPAGGRGGASYVPVDILLELALRSAWWVSPGSGAAQWCHFRDVVLSTRVDGQSEIEVRATRAEQSDDVVVEIGVGLRVTVSAADRPPEADDGAPVALNGDAPPGGGSWHRSPTAWRVEVPAVAVPADQWASLVGPALAVPFPILGVVADAMADEAGAWTASLVGVRLGGWAGGHVELSAGGLRARAFADGELVVVVDRTATEAEPEGLVGAVGP
jgi:NAD(P)-dependent dehydrogenase (short-subunit alcohol dehydrogenase family)